MNVRKQAVFVDGFGVIEDQSRGDAFVSGWIACEFEDSIGNDDSMYVLHASINQPTRLCQRQENDML